MYAHAYATILFSIGFEQGGQQWRCTLLFSIGFEQGGQQWRCTLLFSIGFEQGGQQWRCTLGMDLPRPMRALSCVPRFSHPTGGSALELI